MDQFTDFDYSDEFGYEHVEDDMGTFDIEDIFDQETDEFMGQFESKKEEGMMFLNSKDYSLNSALLIDEMDEFLLHMMCPRTITRWAQPVFDTRREFFTKVFNASSVLPPSENHRWFGDVNMRLPENTKEISALLRKTEKDADMTSCVVTSFLKTWLKKDFQFLPKKDLDVSILKWGAFYLDLHWLTMAVNASSKEELDILIKDKLGEIKTSKEGTILGASYKTGNFGKVSLSHGMVYFHSDRILIDRNFLLMMKDTYAARFQTMLSMVGRHDSKFPLRAVPLLQSIYEVGDALLSMYGNTTYDVLKLLEPTCNLRMTQLAQKYRPLMPEMPDFKNHVETSLGILDKSHPGSGDLFKPILTEDDVEIVLMIYGSFRHWGHPFIDYKAGLKKLYAQTTAKREIDDEYAQALASDLALIVLESEFKKRKEWSVDKDELMRGKPSDFQFPQNDLRYYIMNDIWPVPSVLESYGDKFHLLPLKACFKIPDMFDPSIIYSDKSHSMNYSEILSHLSSFPGKPIPTKKVLTTLLKTEATDWKAFLKEVDERGLDKEYLVIGLREKEREIKILGRFFSLMSWKLRDYFVITEYLIKQHFIPLFAGLTMADDLTTVIKKMMDNANGQGLDDYDFISIANHLDYEKWNNFQRMLSTKYVFRVMGQFLGYPSLIERTHEFFENSFFYHPGRSDLMQIRAGQIENVDGEFVCWYGQAGGLEGLRQKGWCILNLLVIRREGRHRTTKIKCLAQGDNQVICTQYKLEKTRNTEEIKANLAKVVENNRIILSKVEEGTTKLGLSINKDETMQSADYLNYGKMTIFRGNLRVVECKRYGRTTCTTNDQLPTLSSIMSTVSTNSLTVAHASGGPINAMFHYNYLGNFVRNLIEMHNPALRNSIKSLLRTPEKLSLRGYKIAAIYLDPSLGGSCGMALTRFLIRQFPDPITESLTFLKMVFKGTDDYELKQLMIQMGNPYIVPGETMDYSKLIESPISLNLKSGIDPVTIIKDRIKASLQETCSEIQHKLIRESIIYGKEEEAGLITFLTSIKPLFPRFISQYKSCTFMGITDSIVGLFQNSRTIRSFFKHKLEKEIDKVIVKSEMITYSSLLKIGYDSGRDDIWDCSATHADFLRTRSWGDEIIGATVPHPAEMFGDFDRATGFCPKCLDEGSNQTYISLLLPNGLKDYWSSRGPYSAYLGSNTSESTSILQPWEKTTDIPFIKRAAALREAINWFIAPESTLAKSIYQNLESITGVSWEKTTKGFLRTGSALHRFRCSRQSTGGFAAQSPAKLTRMAITTNTLHGIGDENKDFMFQCSILFIQMTAGEYWDGCEDHIFSHFHLACEGCLRPVEERELETRSDYKHPDVTDMVSGWKDETTNWFETRKIPELQVKDWSDLSPGDQSYQVGRAEGFLFGERMNTQQTIVNDGSLFPLTVGKNVLARPYLEGIVDGVLRASALHVLFKYSFHVIKHPRSTLIGSGLHILDLISTDKGMQNIWRFQPFQSLFLSVPHRTPPSYPATDSELGSLGLNYLTNLLLKSSKFLDNCKYLEREVWIFSDLLDTKTAGLIGVSGEIAKTLYVSHLSRENKTAISKWKSIIQDLRSREVRISDDDLKPLISKVIVTNQEVRHAAKYINNQNKPAIEKEEPEESKWGEELSSDTESVIVEYELGDKKEPIGLPEVRIQNPTISGLRSFQCATGSHYKLRAILDHSGLKYNDVLCGGDGSGGIGAMVLRRDPDTKLIFNSLFSLDGINLQGTSPSPPSALELVPSIARKCVNLTDAWNNPSNLAHHSTWKYFENLRSEFSLKVSLIILDMEVREVTESRAIEQQLRVSGPSLLSSGGSIIYKTYVNQLCKSGNVLETVGKYFEKVFLYRTQLTSSHSSEVYVLMKGLMKDRQHNFVPIYSGIHNFLKKSPCFRSEEAEFQRALGVKKLNMFQGVPRNFRVDLGVELIHLLSSLGVESGVSYNISQLIQKGQKTRNPSYMWSSFNLVIGSLVNLSAGFVYSPNPPTNERVISLGCWIVGFGIWLSLAWREISIYQQVLKILKDRFTFSWDVVKFKKRFYNEWSITESKRVKKFLYLDHKMALIGQVIRLLNISFPYEINSVNPTNIDNITAEYNKSLTVENVNNWTGIWSFLLETQDLSKSESNSEGFAAIGSEENSNHWTL
ncbi:MAG: L protein [Apis rhabdovirus 3]|uniref:Replicase n=1 Tax=Apis rhabdovirus 3 TaxID=2873557 RepID=A0A8K1J6W3_9RHAB|nr:MAG: L protein [Apis rhabdovirus 3]UCR92531.1 MAG: L protein [Apis rhabdovirus 3]